MTYTNVMVDIETLGTEPGSIILSIGAVAFNIGRSEKDWKTFNSGAISVRSSRICGFTLDEGTLAWWLRQSVDARALLEHALTDNDECTIGSALGGFRGWFPADACLWGNGADFDNALLSAAYAKLDITPPWKFFNSRCFRTMKNIFCDVLAPPFQGTKHDALADALHQTRHLQAIFAYLNKGVTK